MKQVLHPELGRGEVIGEHAGALIVRFASGIQTCDPAVLQELDDVYAPARWSPALPVVLKALAASVRSVNDQWGVFSAARIALLPHQLWVCKRVLERLPARWLIADDVGLGKTVEAGLVLSALRSSGRLDRFLILAPASLTQQWQHRLGEQFDIRTTIYSAESDTPSSHFWDQHRAVIASIQTLRDDRGGRHARLLSVEWDVVIIDEAHHVHAGENGWTLAYRMVEKMVSEGRTRSLLFFTGTPHRGKHGAFFALMALLRPDLFDPKSPFESQIPRLRQAMIRNNKRLATNMRGEPLFVKGSVQVESWSHSQNERAFYQMLTDYILDGRAWADSLGVDQRRTAFLVLTSIQKLASSSIAAVRRALRKRLENARVARAKRDSLTALLRDWSDVEDQGSGEAGDQRARIVEALAETFVLGEDEVRHLEELLAIAARIKNESRIERIMELLDGPLAGRTVLFFTEYKATQGLLLSALFRRYGKAAATFINGDGLVYVPDGDGAELKLTESRENAARRFNDGDVRFLVSTEAAGEGVDLQRNCHTLIHVDLPWNPMRLHQRAGRLNRYGQKHDVTIITMRNPETVEGRIWECLETKLEAIGETFGAAMEEPEDMRQLVLGSESPGFFDRLFADAPRDPERLSSWFDAQTATFGGKSAVSVVRAMLGEVARFDFQTVSPELPRLDLPDLLPFMKGALVMNRRDFDETDGALGFIVPEAWREWGIRKDYRGDHALLFDRSRVRNKTQMLGGLGARLVDKALQAALDDPGLLAEVRGLRGRVVVFGIVDALTDRRGGPLQVVVGAIKDSSSDEWVLLRDGELVRLLNASLSHPRSPALSEQPSREVEPELTQWIRDAESFVVTRIPTLELPYAKPTPRPICTLIPTG